MKSSFFIVADRGNLKAFRAEKVAADRPHRVNLVQSFSFLDGHTKVGEVNTDSAGGFPAGAANGNGSGGRHQNSISERHYELEADKRTAKHLGGLISNILREEKTGAWSLAAPADMKEAVLGEVEAEYRDKLAEYVPRDLVKIAAADLLHHFQEVKGA